MNPFSFRMTQEPIRGDCAGGGCGFILNKNGEDYELVDGFIDDERVESLRYFIFDENQDEQYFFRLKTAEELVSYPKEQKK